MNKMMQVMMQNPEFRKRFRQPDGSKLDEYQIQMYQENPTQKPEEELTQEEMEIGLASLGIPPELLSEDEEE